VWVVESAHDAYVAAVRFLNRTSTDNVGYYLVQVRFTHGAGGSYQVHFEVLAAPIAWEQPQAHIASPVNPARIEWFRTLLGLLNPRLRGLGFPPATMHSHAHYIGVRWPEDIWIGKYGSWSVRATVSRLIVSVNIFSYPTRRENATAVSILEVELGAAASARMPIGCEILWGSPTGQERQRREQILVIRSDTGYASGDPTEVADWVVQVVNIWVDILRERPVADLDERVYAIADASPDVDCDLSDVDMG